LLAIHPEHGGSIFPQNCQSASTILHNVTSQKTVLIILRFDTV
jgi:hypothetical protein